MNPTGKAIDQPANPFARVKVRHLFWVFLVALIVDFEVQILFDKSLTSVSGGNWAYAFGYIFYGLGTSVVLFNLYDRNIKISRILGRFPDKREVQQTLKLAIPIIIIAIASLFVLFLPLSYLLPDFVKTLLIDIDIKSINFDYPLWNNLISVFIIVFLGPVCEEILFRGVILHRWALKWGLHKGMLISSIAFGILHVDVLGATFFGYVMCILYIQAQSLWVPCIAHIANNFLAVVLSLIDHLIYGTETYTLQDFQSEWWIGGVCVPFAIWWAHRYLKTNPPQPTWHLPYYSDVKENISPLGETS